MTKSTVVFWIGFLLILVPYLGIPSDWKQYTYVGIGVVLVLLGYSLKRAQYLQGLERSGGVRGNDTFVETTQNLFADQ
jgi:hypothetical protein